jgi:hypothetical protein
MCLCPASCAAAFLGVKLSGSHGPFGGLLHPGLYCGLAAHGPFGLAAHEPFFGITGRSYGFGRKSYEGARVSLVGKMLYATLPIFSLTMTMPPSPKNMISNPERPMLSKVQSQFCSLPCFFVLSTHTKNTHKHLYTPWPTTAITRPPVGR